METTGPRTAILHLVDPHAPRERRLTRLPVVWGDTITLNAHAAELEGRYVPAMRLTVLDIEAAAPPLQAASITLEAISGYGMSEGQRWTLDIPLGETCVVTSGNPDDPEEALFRLRLSRVG